MVREAEDDYEVQRDRFIEVGADLTENWWFDHFTIEGYAEKDRRHSGPVYAHAQLSFGTKGNRKNYYLQLTPDDGAIMDEPENQAQKNLSKNAQTWQPGEIPAKIKKAIYAIVRKFAYTLNVE
jgi:hypothetical protein